MFTDDWRLEIRDRSGIISSMLETTETIERKKPSVASVEYGGGVIKWLAV